ncbi:MAG: glycoside hydrolase family 43 protein [Firmicutes bacterium]|nr:glycoside hydrolase family 43 protein [Bacillota bacterium]
MKTKLLTLFLAAATLLTIAGCSGKSIELKELPDEYTYCNGNQITGIGDPFLFTYEGKYYMTSTETGTSYRLYESDDLSTWTRITDIFYSSGTEGWVRGSLWQPEIAVGTDGNFYLYYCGLNDEGSLRIGVAVSDSLTGPYVDCFDAPLFDLGYATIDPHLFIDDDGSMYLYYSRDCSENVVDGHHVSQIYVVELEDYTHVKEGAEHTLLLTPEQSWELLNNGDYQWNEGPEMLKKDGVYYLFYSGGYYGDSSYAIGYATSDSPLGPFVKYESNPIISSTETVSGPGNNSFFYTLDGGELFNAYHTHTVAAIAGGNRKLTIDRCGWREDGTFYMNGPTYTEQPAPSGESTLTKITAITGVEASSTSSGTAEAVVDGEFAAGSSGAKQEWLAEDGEKASITIYFDGEQSIDTLFLYRTYEDSAVPESVKITFSDGSVIKNISFPDDSAEPVILHFDTVITGQLTIEATSLGSAKRFGLAEVGIYSIS